MDGKTVNPRNPGQAVEAGIALIPEDRGRDGLARQLPIAYNVTAASLGRLSSLGVHQPQSRERRDPGIRRQTAHQVLIRGATRRPTEWRESAESRNREVACARREDLPLRRTDTRIDVGAKVEVFEVMDGLARAGAAILMVSSELTELLQVPDRILVMRQGRLTGELPRGSSQEEIMRLAALQEKMARS